MGNMSVNPWEMAFVEFQLATMPRLETYPNYHTFDERIPSVDIGDTVCLGMDIFMKIPFMDISFFRRRKLFDQGPGRRRSVCESIQVPVGARKREQFCSEGRNFLVEC